MFHIFEVVLCVFILIVITYMYVSHVSKNDFIILIFALAILVTYYMSQKTAVHELFDNAISSATSYGTSSSDGNPLALPQSFQNQITLYCTTFSSQSYGGTGKIWNNVIPNPPVNNKGCIVPQSPNTNFMFETDPYYSKSEGLRLNTNMLKGPLSCSLGINLNESFTIMLAFIPNMTNSVVTSDIEILKLYANLSSGGNSISLTIPKSSIVSVEDQLVTCALNLTVGTRTFSSADPSPKVVANTKLILHNKMMTFIYLVKKNDNLSVYYSRSDGVGGVTSKTLIDITLTVSGNDTFSNKECTINATKNWNVGLFNVAILNIGVDLSWISNFEYVVLSNYRNRNDNNIIYYKSIIDDYQALIERVSTCPMDEASCNRCDKNVDWTSLYGVLNASDDCKQNFHNYKNSDCVANPGSCGPCWDTGDSKYNTDTCIATRNIFNKTGTIRTEILNSLTDADIAALLSNPKYAEMMKKSSLWGTVCKYPGSTTTVTATQSPASASISSTPTSSAITSTTNPNSIQISIPHDTTQVTPIKNFYQGTDIIPSGAPIEVSTRSASRVDLKNETPTSMWNTVKSFFTL